MTLPEISHLQFLVLHLLGPKELSGRELRAALRSEYRKTRAAFYQLMDRLTKQGFVRLRVVQVPVGDDGVTVPEHHYKLTAPGLRVMQETRGFYEEKASDADGWMPGLGGA